MTIRAVPFDGQTVTELEWRRLMRWVMSSGVIRGQLNELLVSQRAAGANMSVDIASGEAFAVGHHMRSDAVENVAVTSNGTGNPRIDAVVLRFDFVLNTATLVVVAGTAAAAPAPAAITQDIETTWDVLLAYLLVPASEATSIDSGEVIDARTFASPQEQDAEKVVRLATTAALAASTITGTSRVADANGALAAIDVVTAAVGDDVLDKDHGTGSARGIWRVVDIGSASKPWRMVRSPLADVSAKVRSGLLVRVTEGTANGDEAWLLTTNNPIVLGTTSLTFTQFPVVATAVLLETHTWAIPYPAVEAGDNDFIIPFTVAIGANETVAIERVEHKINGGTSVDWALTVNGAGATGFTGLQSDTTTENTDPANVALADRDKVKPDVSAVTGSPRNWEVTVTLKRTVTIS